MTYTYLEMKKGIWTVGFYKDNDEFCPLSDMATEPDAKQLVEYLNGTPKKEESTS